MAFTVKNWQDAPSTSTPLSATALEDMETRIAAWAQNIVQTTTNEVGFEVEGMGATGGPIAQFRGGDRGGVAGDYLTQIGLTGQNPGIITNGWVTISGGAVAATGGKFESADITISGHSTYMLGVSSDVGSSTTFVLKTGSGGPIFKAYDQSDNNLVQFDSVGKLTITSTAASDELAKFLSGDTSRYAGIAVGRAGAEVTLGSVASAGNFVSGTGVGDAVLKRADATKFIHIAAGGNAAPLIVGDQKIGFYGTTPATKPTVSGSRGGNAALADLLTELATLGLITDSSSA